MIKQAVTLVSGALFFLRWVYGRLQLLWKAAVYDYACGRNFLDIGQVDGLGKGHWTKLVRDVVEIGWMDCGVG